MSPRPSRPDSFRARFKFRASVLNGINGMNSFALGVPPSFDKELIVRQFSSPWFHYFLRYDPAPNLRRITVPVLALNGSLDRQVPAGENLPAISEALKANRDLTIVELPGLNHLFQTATTGGVGEYQDIEETIAPVVLTSRSSSYCAGAL